MPDRTGEQPLYGGQAVIEGVMMRGKNAFSVAVRDPENNIVIHTEPLNPHIYDSFISRTPFLRGLTLLWDALGLGVKSLMFAADVAMPEDEKETQNSAGLDGETAVEKDATDIFQQPVMIGTLILSLAMSVGLFIALPAFIAELTIPAAEQHILSNLVEGAIKLTLIVSYVGLIGFLPDIKRVYGYHGAEHKTINAYEAGAELTPQSVKTFPLEHPRCGTGFLLTVMLISILIFTLVPQPDGGLAIRLGFRILSRIVLVPVIAGISYEFLRFTAKHQDKLWIRIITKPNMALQKLTTREPDLDMLAVAIAAFEQVRNIDINKTEQPVQTAVAAAD